MRKRSARLSFGAAVASMALLASACGGNGGDGVSTGPEEGEGGKEITIGLIPWEEDIAVTNMWKVILEEKGYDVTVENVDVAPLFQGLAQDDIDVFFDAWIPNTHGEYMDEYGDDVEDLGVWYDNATLHLTVPSYVDEVDSIEDLPENADLFDGEIVGIESGSGLVQRTNEDVFPDYGLGEDYELIESSTAAMLSELDSAIAEEEPVVVTLWRPHIAYADYDLKDLEDPEGSLGEGESLHSLGRTGFGEDFSEFNGWLQEFTLSPEELQGLEDLVINEYEGNEEEGARVWLEENPEFLKRTLGPDAEDLEIQAEG